MSRMAFEKNLFISMLGGNRILFREKPETILFMNFVLIYILFFLFLLKRCGLYCLFEKLIFVLTYRVQHKIILI